MSEPEAMIISGKDLHNTVDKLLAVTEGLNSTLVFMSCLALALMTQDPEIDNKKLREGVMEGSQWVHTFLSGMPTESIPKEQIN